jgi:soluble lytic murein transglycosylase-like protein
VTDQSLLPTLAARRLLDPALRPTRAEFADFLAADPRHPLADEVYARARALRHATIAPPPPGRRNYINAGRRATGPRPAALDDSAALLAAGDAAGAYAALAPAFATPHAGAAFWLAGLAAFQLGDFAAAESQFAAAADRPPSDGWSRAGAHYWRARALIGAGRSHEAQAAFEAAAQWPATFYGQLAEAQLGRVTPLDFSTPDLGVAGFADFLSRNPGAYRAAAFAQIGRLSDVEMELRRLHADLPDTDDRAFLSLAALLAAPAAQVRAAEFGDDATAAGHCPITRFAPEDGYRLDRAVLLAVVRQESRFDPTAVSSSNARGLMQLLPSTAADIDKGAPYRAQPRLLAEPGLNMRLGQTYLEWLKQRVSARGDLGLLFAAYNGGPGWLGRWLATTTWTNDPLMLLEAMPRAESRDYAERTLAFVGLCRKRFGQRALELEALAAGQPAFYRPQDARARFAAR